MMVTTLYRSLRTADLGGLGPYSLDLMSVLVYGAELLMNCHVSMVYGF